VGAIATFIICVVYKNAPPTATTTASQNYPLKTNAVNFTESLKEGKGLLISKLKFYVLGKIGFIIIG
jgi:hypothetical protein